MTKIDYTNKKFLTEEDTQKEDLQYCLEQTEYELQSAISTTKRDIRSYEATIRDLEQTYPLDLKKLCETQEKLQGAKNAVVYMENLQKRFGFKQG